MLTIKEAAYLAAEPVRYAFYRGVRKDLRNLLRAYRRLNGGRTIRVLDVGARKSPYTIGLKADVVLLDVPRETAVQADLKLGWTEEITNVITNTRSNVTDVVLADILDGSLPAESFDIITMIEVIEHIEEDSKLIRELYRILVPGGVCYLTTPNGVAIPKKNRDHVRHYSRPDLETVCGDVFEDVSVGYAVRRSRSYYWSIQPWTLTAPLQTIKSAVGSLVNGLENVRFPFEGMHLVATCTKRVELEQYRRIYEKKSR